MARSYADALIADGDLEAAAVEVGRVSRWSEQDFGCALAHRIHDVQNFYFAPEQNSVIP